METHVHGESTADWNRTRMAAHLQATHGMQIPMSWDNGQLHQAHLDAHQAAQRATITTEAEEAPMTQIPNQTPTKQLVTAATAVQRPLPRQHTPQSMPPVTADDPQVEADARALWAQETGRPEDSWEDTSRDTRAHFRRKIRQRQIGYAAASREHEERYADHRIMVDRITAVMAGLDFDREWVADDGIGPNVRGALRVTFQRAAEQTLNWLERGGLAAIPGYLDLLNEEVRGQRDEALRQAAQEKAAGAEARRQMGEQQRSMQEMAQKILEAEADRAGAIQSADQARQLLADAEAQLRLLTGERDRLDQQMVIDQREHGASLDAVQRQLEESERRRLGLFHEMEQIRRQLEEAVAERDLLRQDKARLKADLEQMATGSQRNVGSIDALEEELADARDERDRAQQALMQKLVEAGQMRDERDQARQVLDKTVRRLAERTQVLDEGRSKLRTLVNELRDNRWEGSSVYQALTEILGSVSTVTEASQAPAEQPTLIRGDASGVRHITLEEARAEDEGEDDLAWARRFATGGEA